MENKSHAIAAGIFVLLLLALLLGMTAWLMRDTTNLRPFEISSNEAVTGLQLQAAVRYKGVHVGRVTAIVLDPKVPGSVLVRIAVDETTPVTSTTFASLAFQGVTGLAFVQLDDLAEPGVALASSTRHVARIPLRPGLMARLSERGTHMLGQLDEASLRLNALLAEDKQKALVRALDRLSQAAADMGQLSRHADQVLTGTAAPGGVSLPQLASQADASLKSLVLTSERLRESAEVVKASAENFRRTTVRLNEGGGTLDKIARATDEAARTLRQAGRLAEGLTEQPQSLLLGRNPPAPGPGEPGFVPPLQTDH